MKRWISTIFLFLLLGAIMNVAVAWGCAIIARPLDRQMPISHALPGLDVSAWMIGRPSEFPLDAHLWERLRYFGVELTYVGAIVEGQSDQGPDDLTVYRLCVKDCGTPLSTFRGKRWSVVTRKGGRWSTLSNWFDGAILPGPKAGSGEAIEDRFLLPLCPLWPGFLINTLFWAIILWLLIPGPFVMRRLIRIRRGRCPKCGYDLRGAVPGAGGGCPECGWGRQVASKAPGAGPGSGPARAV